ncbi:type III secretion system chaperone [Thalassospira sp.]|uniref:type III secretion system chaperone n=1 Tax=Thalassospira sp. TaxID=1912094 RepID=UPI000C482E1A|nr:type III secretion system chaperone [Thalassospira sp.]MBC05405.1 hypothetical protein [Thalassospira sp.]|tara:strand:- start:5886 stop:6347 length:462 start_codon:yes stop_codon:yes gene_type:complete
MDFKNLITEFGKSAGLDQLTVTEDGTCAIRFDDRITLNIERDAVKDVTHLYVVLANAEQSLSAEKMRMMLCGNLFGHDTGGATLALDDNQREIVLCRYLDFDIPDVATLTKIIEKLAQSADQWIEKLDKATATKPQSSASKTASPFPNHFQTA